MSNNLIPAEAEIRRHLRGNLCRCSGYVQIVEAIQACGTGAGQDDEEKEVRAKRNMEGN